MVNQLRRMMVAAAASVGLAVGAGGAASAASPPLSDSRIVAHFDFSAGQTPENIALEPDGSADVSFAFADEADHVTLDGRVEPLGRLPKSGACPAVGAPISVGIARSHDGTVYLLDCTGNADTGVWRIRRGLAPVHIATLPAASVPNGMALDERHGVLYIADSALATVWRVPIRGGDPVAWASGPALAKTSFLGANGIKVHQGAVWVTNTDRGTVVNFPIRRDGTAGQLRTAATGLATIDDFAFVEQSNIIVAALNRANQVVIIEPGGEHHVVLTSDDGLSNPSSVAVRDHTVHVCSAAYLTMKDPNLLLAHLDS